MTRSRRGLIALMMAGLFPVLGFTTAKADSTSPRLAAYYDLKLLICGSTAYQWRGNERPKPVATDIAQVGAGRDAGFGLTLDGRLLTWNDLGRHKRELLNDIAWFSAGHSGVLAARRDGALHYMARPKSWFFTRKLAAPVEVARSAMAASIGDSADYFVKSDGILLVRGLAHRGQYGDGKLKASSEFIPVARDVLAIKAHTGHALLLKRDGRVMGTGGNIYGPLGRHGIGDKAVVWGTIFRGATAIATGSSHSLAIRPDGTLWHWGRGIGLDAQKILDDVAAAAADRRSSIALLNDNSLWQWTRDQPPGLHFRCP